VDCRSAVDATQLADVGRHLLLQFSDIHLAPSAHHRVLVNSLANLDRAIELIVASPCRPEGILLTGDLADTGDPLAYQLLRERIAGLTAAIGTRAVYVPGNHDDRNVFREHLLPPSTGRSAADPIDQVHFFGGLRVISMDTTVPGTDAGALSGDQLDWLRSQLATPAPDGTVLALHHPPIGSPIEPMAALALAEPARLQAAIESSDVCLVVAGHDHHATAGMLGRVPVWISPALSYRSDALASAEYKPRAGSAFTRIDVIDRRPLVTVVPVPPPERVDQE
jgi:3',5'-cyclic AMP phosphodiesterase CpdA